MTDEQTEIFEGLMSPRITHFEHSKLPKYSQHPVLANLNDFCNHHARLLCQNFVSSGHGVMSIGDSVNAKIPPPGTKMHNCIKIDNLRDCYRTTASLLPKATSAERTTYLEYSILAKKSPLVCAEGTINCTYKADVCVAVHSMYDFTMEEVFKTFNAHGLKQLIVYVYIPYQLYDPSMKEIDEKIFNIKPTSYLNCKDMCKVSADQIDYFFCMKDSSIPYIHNKKKWIDWANVTKISSPSHDFVIVRETIATYGQLQILNLIRAPKYNGLFHMTVPISSWCKGFYLVPDICQYIRDKRMLALTQAHLRHFMVPCHVVDGLLAYANRAADDSYNYKEIATLAQGYKRMLKIGDRVYFDNWNIEPESYYRVVLSLFVIGAVFRTHRTKDISSCFAELKALSNSGFFSTIMRSISAFGSTIMMNIIGNNADNRQAHGEFEPIFDINDAENLLQFRPYIPSDFTVSQHFNVDLEIENLKITIDPEELITIRERSPSSHSSGDSSSDSSSRRSSISEPNINDTPIPTFIKSQPIDIPKVENLPQFNGQSVTYKTESPTDNEMIYVMKDAQFLSSKLGRKLTHQEYEEVKTSSAARFHKNNLAKGIISEVKGFRKVASTYADIPTIKGVPFKHTANTSNELRLVSIPRHFKSGHCAMQAFYDAYFSKKDKLHCKMAIRDFLELCRNLLHKSGMIESVHIDNYIILGDWQKHHASQLILPELCKHFSTSVEIITSDGGNILVGDSDEKIKIYHSNDHFSAAPTGGVREKFSAMCNYVVETIKKSSARFPNDDFSKPFAIIDIGAAPGSFGALLSARINKVKCADINADGIITDHDIVYLAYHYKGKDSLKFNQDNFEAIKKNGGIIREFGNFQDLRKIIFKDSERYNISYIFSDAASDNNTEEITNGVNSIIQDLLPNLNANNNICLTIKTFGNAVSTWKLGTNFEHFEVYEGETSGSEKYYTMYHALGENLEILPKKDIEVLYNTYHSFETEHVCNLDKASILQHARELFSDIFSDYEKQLTKKLKEGLDHQVGKNYRVPFTAITGFASAAKTTYAINKYVNSAVFIAPTKYLSNHHSNLGATSKTFHAIIIDILTGKMVPKHIIVDECSQFFAEYIAILHAIYPGSKITILGDVYQTPATNFRSKRTYTTFHSVGVINNKWETYKIPVDITKCLNTRLGFNMIPRSGVTQSISWIKELPILAPKQKSFTIIVFNSATCQQLKKRGFNAETITSYTGSRDHTVGFYVDSAAIASSLIGKTEFVYTAMTRATDRLVLIGQESKALITYFAISGHTIDTYQDLNNAYIESGASHKIPEEEIPALPLQQQEEGIVVLPVTVENATSILKATISNANVTDIADIRDTDIQPIQEGTLVTTIDQLQEAPKIRKVYKVVPNISLVKKQVSDSTLRTIQTMVGRYSKKTIENKKSDYTFLKSELVAGLSKALSGNNDSYTKFTRFLTERRSSRTNGVNHHFNEYLKSLDKKMGKNAKIKEVLDQPFNEFDEMLDFFNKRQTKFDPKPGFDTSNKVGQGVASMSKNVNILFSCYARYILDAARDFAKISNVNVIIATHDSEAGLDSEYKRYCENWSEDQKMHSWVCNDFSEWDTRYHKIFSQIMWELMVSSGCPAYLADWFFNFRQHWTMQYNNKSGKTKLKGKSKQFSGNPFTICENTLMDMALVNCILEFNGIDIALYKGDDSAIKCASVKYSARYQHILSLTGHKAKLHIFKTGEFAGWALTNHGFFPDVVRYAAKFIDKDYRDEEHFNESLQSLKERVSAVKTQYQKSIGSLALTEFYPELNAEQIEQLFDFLASSLNCKFSDLVFTDKHEIF
jgi:hypothetical protein